MVADNDGGKDRRYGAFGGGNGNGSPLTFVNPTEAVTSTVKRLVSTLQQDGPDRPKLEWPSLGNSGGVGGGFRLNPPSGVSNSTRSVAVNGNGGPELLDAIRRMGPGGNASTSTTNSNSNPSSANGSGQTAPGSSVRPSMRRSRSENSFSFPRDSNSLANALGGALPRPKNQRQIGRLSASEEDRIGEEDDWDVQKLMRIAKEAHARLSTAATGLRESGEDEELGWGRGLGQTARSGHNSGSNGDLLSARGLSPGDVLDGMVKALMLPGPFRTAAGTSLTHTTSHRQSIDGGAERSSQSQTGWLGGDPLRLAPDKNLLDSLMKSFDKRRASMEVAAVGGTSGSEPTLAHSPLSESFSSSSSPEKEARRKLDLEKIPPHRSQSTPQLLSLGGIALPVPQPLQPLHQGVTETREKLAKDLAEKLASLEKSMDPSNIVHYFKEYVRALQEDDSVAALVMSAAEVRKVFDKKGASKGSRGQLWGGDRDHGDESKNDALIPVGKDRNLFSHLLNPAANHQQQQQQALSSRNAQKDNGKGRGSKQQQSSKRSIREPDRQMTIVTTASLPWMTGTAVNPLLRAAFLSRINPNVTLMVPWLTDEDQKVVYPNKITFQSPREQEEYVREWVQSRVGFPADFKIRFYPGKYAKDKGSILPVGDITQLIPDGEADVAVLEEPEHLTWYHHGGRWTDKFSHVVGVIHTNYLEYVKREGDLGPLKAFLLEGINHMVCRVHCHQVIRLSGATQDLPRSSICNVHGVSPKFLEIGAKLEQARDMASAVEAANAPLLSAAGLDAHIAGIEDRHALAFASSSLSAPLSAVTSARPSLHSGSASSMEKSNSTDSLHGIVSGEHAGEGGKPCRKTAGGVQMEGNNGVYFIGKVVWSKGYRELLNLVAWAKTNKQKEISSTVENLVMDVYGTGADLPEVEEEAKRLNLPLKFHGARDHADKSIWEHKVFVNPSLSDVLCTTTAEALAMGKFVVIANHPSNEFFKAFPNCLTYNTPEEFADRLKHAMGRDPSPLTAEQRHALTWEAATERFLDAAEPLPSPVTLQQKLRKGKDHVLEDTLSAFHYFGSGNEFMRSLAGALPSTMQCGIAQLRDLQVADADKAVAINGNSPSPLPITN